MRKRFQGVTIIVDLIQSGSEVHTFIYAPGEELGHTRKKLESPDYAIAHFEKLCGSYELFGFESVEV